MSNIDDIVKSAQGGRLIDNLSERIGLASWQTEAAVLALTPALSAALTRAAETPETLRPLIAAMGDPRYKAAFESAESAQSDASVEAGDAMVAQLFGSPAAAGEVAQLAARASGLRADVLQRLLSALVALVAGGISSTLSQRGLDEALLQAGASAASAPVAPRPAPVGGLTGFLASLFGKRPAPVAAQPEEPSPAPAPEEVAAQIRQIFATSAPVATDQEAELDALLGRVSAPPRS
ncbi:DUF937 domain-containing protein [Methylosinus sp. Sm6]|uniref:DUF937 domain-containing protein n=1 Tax=Methylosinus sp. Sm6 TaxID=2866948 RepID=UPI001C98F3FB|nr:DUF937 domain-containing protein [Methylosinus sp. Sm6]MBY6243337.1 DUF937 domain-containing protein [Methylosinus sp. Sm6]